LFLFATESPDFADAVISRFQSQAGFVPLCDPRHGRSEAVPGRRFNPRRDLFLFATIDLMADRIEEMSVSIPGGICSSLRLSMSLPVESSITCFNPRRDLFLFATQAPRRDRARPTPRESFNPRRDLFLFATRVRSEKS